MFDDDSLRQVEESNDPRSPISRMTDGDGASPMQDSLQVWCHGVPSNNEQVRHGVP